MRGLYPSDLDKVRAPSARPPVDPESPAQPCQDAFCVKEATGAHWFMIFDGHGSAGHHCADFAKDGECNVVSLPTGSSGSAVASRSANALVAVERR